MSDTSWRCALLTCSFVTVARLVTLCSVVSLLTRPEEAPPAPQRIPTRDNYATERTVEL